MAEVVEKLALVSMTASKLCKNLLEPMLSKTPLSLGFPSTNTQSAYYPEPSQLSRDEIRAVLQYLERHHIHLENTRIRKDVRNGNIFYSVLQASINRDPVVEQLPTGDSDLAVRLLRGDHSMELCQICEDLSNAKEYTANTRRSTFISQYIKSFQTGDLEQYRESQRIWVADRAPNTESIFGFVEAYRDPSGIRAEFEVIVAISDTKETKVLSRLVEASDTNIRRLAWAAGCTENNGKGPFEKYLFEPPDFASIHNMIPSCALKISMC
jgi:dipeptidyl-peptidase III